MTITFIGGTGAMGLIFGSRLAKQGYSVVLFDVNKESVSAVNSRGAKITNHMGEMETITNLRATGDPYEVGDSELVFLFTKCYWTAGALALAEPFIGKNSTVVSLQNGWGNYDQIREYIDPQRILVGVNYISGTTLAPGHAKQAGQPSAVLGKVGATANDFSREVAALLTRSGIHTEVSDKILDQIFAKLALNAATLAPSALLHLEAHQLLEQDMTVQLMDSILEEVVAVAKTQGVILDYAETRNRIHDVLRNAVGAKSSMLQDVEAKRQTEIDVINGAIVRMGALAGIPTLINEQMVSLIKAKEKTYLITI